jgi:hypothetical protein
MNGLKILSFNRVAFCTGVKFRMTVGTRRKEYNHSHEASENMTVSQSEGSEIGSAANLSFDVEAANHRVYFGKRSTTVSTG